MAINFNQTFGMGNQAARGGNTNEAKPVAQYWLNVGYTVDVTLEDGSTEATFVSLPIGIPLDTMKLANVNSSNDFWAGLQNARNGLHGQMMSVCETLKAGEEKIIALDETSGLSIQLRRVKEAREPVKAADNPFSKKLAFA